MHRKYVCVSEFSATLQRIEDGGLKSDAQKVGPSSQPAENLADDMKKAKAEIQHKNRSIIVAKHKIKRLEQVSQVCLLLYIFF